MTYHEILDELRSSDRWGINHQPERPEPVAQVLSALPVTSVRMKGADTLVVRFSRALTDEEADRLRAATNLDPEHDEDPFVRDAPKLEAYCWWD